MIEGVVVKKLITLADRRGFFREIIRGTDNFFAEGFGQLSHSRMFNGVTKAWHYHHVQVDWWYVASGVLRVGLYDLRGDSATNKQTVDLLMGDLQPAQVIKIPPGVAYGCQTVQGPVDLFYITSGEYNAEDEFRMKYDDPEVGFDWLDGPPIK